MTAPRSRMPSIVSPSHKTVRIQREDLGQGSSRQSPKHFLLVCLQGLEVGKPTELTLAETIVGRTSSAGLVLANSQISRKHAKLTWVDGHHVLEDLNSANGTFVQGVRITRQHLNPGDIIQFGSTFAYRYSVTDQTEKSIMEQLYQSSVLDALTGAYNREYFNTVLSAELEQTTATALSTGLSLLLFDIDHFKKINDTYGHPAGDAVLIELVARVQLRLRSSDVLCRYGGEEFAVILRATKLDDAVCIAERYRQAVRKQNFVHDNNSFPVTVSIGCASIACCEAPATVEAMATVADRRLYAAKHAGRDRVVHTD